ncbi:hypothetical protein A2926_01110 [Candidatus Giovannonibacteria bacterium RIFCSPLOWO2_01_FULL_44_40]|uniref:Plasmid stabilization protein n=1 Tax=Candidatus Giovannonibacteria bacterium RIFCSPHIGHO2_01_FULL_45_23 TaxID=1798325 RepID=A0A1F5VGR8_9BACT|nr:MAG: hypothetical protein A2834_02580 [Candidatus Giovannonibacteria bacterium RIFCSPHIGHO2_01_FULL_45_23]OGF75197.1 MAG: hypothetical protein A3C77_03820 [Candidatus Giovannonibacteria bacterium RIFCSPHIGHO2_02_FULL_45_13]OGF80036.1 MAG: hypothetical protein A2926_01110 [Candidatus Giovannonibacteria bacterium RIFCSPLOWO2_01_FULL_44_40]
MASERPVRSVYYSSRFKKSLERMPNFVKKAFLEKEGVFMRNAFYPLLRTHQLHGKYKDYWAFTVIGQHRVMFKFLNKECDVGLIDIGTHEIYK